MKPGDRMVYRPDRGDDQEVTVTSVYPDLAVVRGADGCFRVCYLDRLHAMPEKSSGEAT